MSRLKMDDIEALGELFDSPGYSVFMSLLDTSAASIEQAVLSLQCSTDNERDLFIRKARAEGARQLISAVKTRVEQQRPKR